jgi:hypothetical protein
VGYEGKDIHYTLRSTGAASCTDEPMTLARCWPFLTSSIGGRIGGVPRVSRVLISTVPSAFNGSCVVH